MMVSITPKVDLPNDGALGIEISAFMDENEFEWNGLFSKFEVTGVDKDQSLDLISSFLQVIRNSKSKDELNSFSVYLESERSFVFHDSKNS
jgi:hypothetical protein